MSGRRGNRQTDKDNRPSQNPGGWEVPQQGVNPSGGLREEPAPFITGNKTEPKSKRQKRISGVDQWRARGEITGKMETFRSIDMKGKDVGKALAAVFQLNVDEARAENVRVIGVPDVAPGT
jgi:hypothetical protein